MKRRWLFGVSFLVAAVASAQHQSKQAEINREDGATAYIARYTSDKWLLILDAERDFYSARREAERLSKLSGLEFWMGGTVHDKRRGLITPDDANDSYAGEYVLRRYDSHPDKPKGYISIEKSDAYPGLRDGYYVVVGAICNSSREANAKLRRFQRFVPSAYVARTQIFMGCIH